MKSSRLDLTLEYPGQREAGIVFGALSPEMDQGPTDRCRQECRLEGNRLEVFIEADDATSLRASVNSTWRWLKLADELMKE